ncbi:hypothetical protein L9F63_010429, partial [Diploptera punctata]
AMVMRGTTSLTTTAYSPKIFIKIIIATSAVKVYFCLDLILDIFLLIFIQISLRDQSAYELQMCMNISMGLYGLLKSTFAF